MRRPLALALAGTVLAVAVALLATRGTDAGARNRSEDAQTLRAIYRIAGRLRCDRPDTVLPQALTVADLAGYCGGREVAADDLFDPARGTPLVFRRLSDREFAVCGTFHNPRRAMGRLGTLFRRWEHDPAAGCVLGGID